MSHLIHRNLRHHPPADRRPGQSRAEYTAAQLAELEDTIVAAGPDRVLGFCAETVVGATAGAVAPTPGYFQGVRALCDKYGILLIIDEVMCGMGRTGSLYAIEQEGVLPDLVALGKGLGAGYQPIGAVPARLREAFGAHPHVGDIRGRGLLLGMELVRERDSKERHGAAYMVGALSG